MDKLCDCGKQIKARGLCSNCYQKARSNGLQSIRPRVKPGTPCRDCGVNPRHYKTYCKKCGSARVQVIQQKRLAANPTLFRDNHIKKYGITVEQWREMVERGCAICGDTEFKPRIDHDHSCCSKNYTSCGRCVRGVLCTNCNMGLGMFRDDPDRLERAAEYLDEYASRRAQSSLGGTV